MKPWKFLHILMTKWNTHPKNMDEMTTFLVGSFIKVLLHWKPSVPCYEKPVEEVIRMGDFLVLGSTLYSWPHSRDRQLHFQLLHCNFSSSCKVKIASKSFVWSTDIWKQERQTSLQLKSCFVFNFVLIQISVKHICCFYLQTWCIGITCI